MQKTKFISSILLHLLALSSLTVLSNYVATAQPRRMFSLLRAKCVSSGIGTARQDEQNISIGRAVFTSQFFLGPGSRSAAMTCRIRPENRPDTPFQTLTLGFGMRDNNTTSPPVDVKVFLDGQQIESRTVNPAQQTSLTLDVSNVSNVSVEASCSNPRQYCDRVYFFTSSLEQKMPVVPATPNKK